MTTATAAVEGVLDPAVLDDLAALGMGEGFEREFIQQCLADAERCLAAMGAAARQGDWNDLREQAHAVKGVASNLGLVMLAEEGGELMRLADWQLKNDWRARLDQLGAGLQAGRKALDARAQARTERGQGADPPP